MEQTTMAVEMEWRDYERKRNVLRKIMQNSAATASEERMANYRQLMHDYNSKIIELTDEINERRDGDGLAVQ